MIKFQKYLWPVLLLVVSCSCSQEASAQYESYETRRATFKKEIDISSIKKREEPDTGVRVIDDDPGSPGEKAGLKHSL